MNHGVMLSAVLSGSNAKMRAEATTIVKIAVDDSGVRIYITSALMNLISGVDLVDSTRL